MKVSRELYVEMKELRRTHRNHGLSLTIDKLVDYKYIDDFREVRRKMNTEKDFFHNIIRYIEGDMELDVKEEKYHLMCNEEYVVLNTYDARHVFIDKELLKNKYVQTIFTAKEIKNNPLLDNSNFEWVLIEEDE